MGQTAAERQTTYRLKWHAEVDAMPKIPCACGCGILIPPITRRRTPAKYKRGHAPGKEATQFQPGQQAWNKGQPAPWSTRTHKGTTHPPEQAVQSNMTKLLRYGPSLRSPECDAKMREACKNWRRSPEYRARMSIKNTGEGNPFYGMHHTEETKEKLRASRIGPLNHSWKGDDIIWPYGHDFSHRFRRLIRQRDGMQCRICGAVHTGQKKAFPIHHIDFNKKNNDPDNLITLCTSCHRRIHHNSLHYPMFSIFLG